MWKAVLFFAVLLACIPFGLAVGMVVGGIMIPVYIISAIVEANSNGGGKDDEI